MKNKLFWICALAVLTLGLFPALSYAEGDTVIDTNGTVTIKGNDITITPNGNQPLIINNVNLPSDKNLIINGNNITNNVLPHEQLVDVYKPGPIITVTSNPNINPVILTGIIDLNQPKTAVPQVETPHFPQIIKIDDPITPEPKQVEWKTVSEDQKPYSNHGATMYMTSQINAASGAVATESSLVNLQGVEQAHDLTVAQGGEIILS